MMMQFDMKICSNSNGRNMIGKLIYSIETKVMLSLGVVRNMIGKLIYSIEKVMLLCEKVKVVLSREIIVALFFP